MSDDIDTLIARAADAQRLVDKTREMFNAAEAAHREARTNLGRAEGRLHDAIAERIRNEAAQENGCSP
jgi:predicted phage gp36 major capsid-like protein